MSVQRLLTVEHAILRFQIVADNGGRHIEHVLYTYVVAYDSVDYLYVLSKAMMRHLGVVFEAFFTFNKIPIILFCRYPISMQFRCIVFATDGSQISSLIMDTLYISILIVPRKKILSN